MSLTLRGSRIIIRAVAHGKVSTSSNSSSARSFKWWFCGEVFDLLRAQGRFLIVAACIVWCVYVLSSTIRGFAGQNTVASFTFSLLANIIVKWALTMTVSGLSLALYFRERNQHEKTKERLTNRITLLEMQIDPKRTSSHLTSRGKTRKEDE